MLIERGREDTTLRGMEIHNCRGGRFGAKVEVALASGLL